MTTMIHEDITKPVNDAAETKKARRIKIVENLQLLGLALTITGQVLVRFDLALMAQILWLVANLIALGRDFYLHRPMADKVKNAALTALTIGLCISLII